MSVFTLAISCLAISNLQWFMDLTSQVPMQYCSLQHWTSITSHIHVLSGVISPLFSSIILGTYQGMTLPTKVCLVKAMVFPVIMYGCESWTVSWALQNWCFWTVVLEKTLESLLNCKEIQPVTPKRNQSWYSLEGLMLKLKLQYFGHLMRRADSGKDLDAGKTEGKRRRGWQRMRWLDSITDSMDMNLGKPHEIVRDMESWHASIHGVSKSWDTT